MRAYDFDAVSYNGAVYCINCLPQGVSIYNEDVAPIFASDEMDSYPHCDKCGYVHKYMELTNSRL
jgi:hypothetical protein